MTAVALVAAAAALSGCGSDAPAQRPSGEVVGGAIGPDERVSEDLAVLAVHLAHPADGVYEPGEDASLVLAISNTGTAADELVDVTGPDFADARTADAGGATPVVEVPAGEVVHVGAGGGPTLTLVDLDRSLRSSQSIPVTFSFRRAGTVTVEAMVEAAPSPTRGAVDPDQGPVDG